MVSVSEPVELSLADRVAQLSWPNEKSLAEIARELAIETGRKVSRQYIHQVVNELSLPYNPYGRKRTCKKCGDTVYKRNTYCDRCIIEVAWIPRTGKEYACVGCGVSVYRNRAQLRGKVKQIYHNRDCYLEHLKKHQRDKYEHSVLSE